MSVNRRKFSGHGPRPDKGDLKKAEAKERFEAWNKLSTEEQLASLDARGVTATKQRARIASRSRVSVKKVLSPVADVIERVVETSEQSASKPKKLKAKDRRALESVE